MTLISHHSHSGQFCLHAKGTLEEVVLKAIAKGFTTFGLTEHIPRSRSQDLYPEEAHLQPSDLVATFEAFISEAHRLKKQYASQITLLVGLETEFIRLESIEEIEHLLATHGDRIEYLVGSLHHVKETPIDFDKETFDKLLNSFSFDTEKERFGKIFEIYFDNQYTLLDRLQPEVIGHFDLCRLYYPEQDFRDYDGIWEKIERNIRKGVEYGAMFEINASAIRKGWKTAYPGKEIFDLIVSLGGRLTLSDDSHGPQAVGLHYEEAYKYMSEQGLKELWYLDPATKNEVGRPRGVSPRKVEGRPWEKEWPDLLAR